MAPISVKMDADDKIRVGQHLISTGTGERMEENSNQRVGFRITADERPLGLSAKS